MRVDPLGAVLETRLMEGFDREGYYGPVQLFSRRECRAFLDLVLADDHPAPLDWGKGGGATSRSFYEAATRPELMAVVEELLGPDVLLWGASIQSRSPGRVHAWHSDIEVTDPGAKTLAVWIGLRGTTADSSLSVVTRSHLFPTIQEVRYRSGVERDAATEDQIRAWARELDDGSDVVRVEMVDGEALFFDGRMWHGSVNLGKETRHALLLQYATPESPIRIPDLGQLDWPFRRLEVPRPPCLLVRGRAVSTVNRVVPAPVTASSSLPELTSLVRPLTIPLPETDESWQPHPLFRGLTADIELSCHASRLGPNHSPHPPHRHVEEEILLLLRGSADLELPEVEGGTVRLGPGELVYYPAWFPHTLTTVSAESAEYVMFKWSSEPRAGHAMGYERHDVKGYFEQSAAGFVPRVIAEGPTGCLRKLQIHASTLSPGAGYEPHIDSYDVAIVILEGEVETLGGRVEPYGVVFYRAGEPHGMHNPTDRPARYVVFEFHGVQGAMSGTRSPRRALTVSMKRVVKRVVPERWISRIRRSLPFR